jgi:hypothetical protein
MLRRLATEEHERAAGHPDGSKPGLEASYVGTNQAERRFSAQDLPVLLSATRS